MNLKSLVIKEMKEQVEETHKVDDVSVFKDYLELIVYHSKQNKLSCIPYSL